MSQVRAKSIKRKIKNVKARRDIKRRRAKKNKNKAAIRKAKNVLIKDVSEADVEGLSFDRKESIPMDWLSKKIKNIIQGFDEETMLNFSLARMGASQTGDNDPCWCQSGNSYKNCHMKRHEGRKLIEGEYLKETSKIFDKKKYCSAIFDSKNCQLPIKGAHTIQRGRVLSSLAKDGHVGTFYRNSSGYENIRDIAVGVKKQASIFYGFCDFHDNDLFKNIELSDFSAEPSNFWASSYRAVCHEFYQKSAAKDVIVWQIENLDKGYTLNEQLIIQELLKQSKRDIFKGFECVSSIKDKYENAKIKQDYGLVSSYLIVFDEPLKIAVCASISPYYDINGVKVQNLGDPSYLFQHFSLSTVTVDGCAAYVISYLNEHKVIENYLLEVFRKDRSFIKSWLTKSIFAYTENCFFNLDWWDGLGEDKKNDIYGLAMSENYTVPFVIDSMVSDEVPGSIVSVDRV